MEQLTFKNAPDLHSGRLGVIEDFKTWLENVFEAKNYRILVQKSKRLTFKNAPDSHSGRLEVIEDFKTWLETIPVAKTYQFLPN